MRSLRARGASGAPQPTAQLLATLRRHREVELLRVDAGGGGAEEQRGLGLRAVALRRRVAHKGRANCLCSALLLLLRERAERCAGATARANVNEPPRWAKARASGKR